MTNVDADTLGGISSTSFLRSDIADIKTSGDLTFNNGVQAKFGTGGEMQIRYDGNNGYLQKDGNGEIYIRNTTNLRDVVIQTDDGSGGHTDYILADGSTGGFNFTTMVLRNSLYQI